MLRARAFMARSPFETREREEGSRKWLIEQLDILTSIIVRKRDRSCVTCGSRRKLQCSHFYSRRYLSIRFNLINCNAQCRDCNLLHNEMRAPYEDYMLETYGESAVAELDQLRRCMGKVSDGELKELYEQYVLIKQ
jgi:hypothetical protein